MAGELTIEDYECLPDALACSHELVHGELVRVPGNKPPRNLPRGRLIELLLLPHVRIGRLGIVISSQSFDFCGDALAPDVSYISEARVPLLNDDLRVQRFVPDLAIEIASANDTFAALTKRVQRYRRCGTPEAWIFSLETRGAFLFSEHRRPILDENDEFLPETIPGFAIRIGELLDRCQ